MRKTLAVGDCVGDCSVDLLIKSKEDVFRCCLNPTH